MQVLESRLYQRNKKNSFDHLDNRIRCYTHIINICSSHIIASMTATLESYLSSLKVPVDESHMGYRDSDSGLDDGSSDDGLDDGDPNEGSDEDSDEDSYVDDVELVDSFNSQGDDELEEWFAAVRRDPLRCTRKLISFLRSSPQRKEGLSDIIKEGNMSNQFIGPNESGSNLIVFKVPEVQLLKDVKTRWDSVFLMLQRLQQLRPVGLS